MASGGAERVVSLLLKHLHVKYDITLVLMRKKIEYEIPKDIKIHYLENSRPFENGLIKLLKLPLLALKYKKFCKKNRIDISFALMNRPCYIAIISKIFGNNCLHIISERSTPSSIYKEENFKSSINKFLIKKLYPKADKIVANSSGNRDDLIYNFQIKKDKISIIYNPCDLKYIREKSDEKVKFRDKDFTFITIGRLDDGKNHKLLIDAIKNIKAKLFIIGAGALKDKLILHVKQNSLEEKVIFLGSKDNPYKYLKQADCFVFSSNYEGFPNVLLEALACKLPIISTDCKSGPREILAPDTDMKKELKSSLEIVKYGILVPINDKISMQNAMNKMISDKHLKDKYKTIASKRAEDFDINILIKEFDEIFTCKGKK